VESDLAKFDVDIVIPVYNEGENILRVLRAFRTEVKTPAQILICYDHTDDTTLDTLRISGLMDKHIIFVKNRFKGAHGAVRSGFLESKADSVITYMADDDYNAGLIDKLVASFQKGNDLVAPSRFIPGGVFEGCRWPKKFLVRASSWSMYALAGIPVHDATNGFRLFSRRLMENVLLESSEGFTYSIELLVKCHRLGWRIAEVPALWYERTSGQSRFKVLPWAHAYLRWYWYAFETTYLRRRSL
jgi:glycosyltransferase involved in cell wall biosynthesis